MAPTSDGPRSSRRRFLQASGTTLATGLAALGSGCSGLPPLGTEVRYGSVDVPDADAPAYRDWLPAPSALPADANGSAGYSLMTYTPPPADAPPWARSGIARALIASVTDHVGVHVDDVDLAVGMSPAADRGGAAVLYGGVDRALVDETIPETPYERAGSFGEYDVYEWRDRERAVAVGPDALVFGRGDDPESAIRATVDAGQGEAPRFHERDADFELLTDSTGMRRWSWVTPDGVDGVNVGIRDDTVGWATAWDHEGESIYLVETWLFPEGYHLTRGKVKQSLKETQRPGGPRLRNVSAVDVTVDDRVATVAMYVAPDVVREELADSYHAVPYATWHATYDPGADRLTFHHDAGDPVRTGWLRIDGDGLDVPASAAGDRGARVEPGDELTVSTVDVEPGATVRLVYRAPDADSSTALFSYDLP